MGLTIVMLSRAGIATAVYEFDEERTWFCVTVKYIRSFLRLMKDKMSLTMFLTVSPMVLGLFPSSLFDCCLYG